MANLQDVAAHLKFLTAHQGDRRRIVPGIARLDTPWSVTATAVGTRHENRADAFRRVPREDASGSRGLVVGVGMYRHERQGPASHETVLLQKYVLIRMCDGRTAILGPEPGGADDRAVSVFPARAAPVPQVDTTCRPDRLFPPRPLGLPVVGVQRERAAGATHMSPRHSGTASIRHQLQRARRRV